MSISTTESAIEDFRQGKMIILVDDEDRENEGDLTIAAEFVTPEVINFMAKYGRGLICMPMDMEMADRLDLPLMTQRNGSRFGTNFTVSIEAREGVTTGISARGYPWSYFSIKGATRRCFNTCRTNRGKCRFFNTCWLKTRCGHL